MSSSDQTSSVSITFASEIRQRSIQWLWRGWLPWKKLILWEGDPDVGKSLVTLDIAARATRGDLMPDGESGELSSVLLLCAEDDAADTVKPRLIAAGADLSKVAFLTLTNSDGAPGLFSLPSGVETLTLAIAGLKRRTNTKRTIVIIDPITAFLDDNTDPNKDAEVRRLTTLLAYTAARTGSLVILVRHLNKSVAVANAKYRGSGSIAWTAAARAVYVFANHPSDPTLKVMAATKNNIASSRPSIAYRLVVRAGDEVPHVEWAGAVEIRADDLLKADARKEAPQRDEATTLLVELLDSAEGSVAARDVARAARERGISEASMKRAADRMELRKRKVPSPDTGRQMSVWERVSASEESEL